MSQSISFWRKIIYVAAIALLLFPLYYIGRPASRRDRGGGMLAQLRQQYGLAQANLGEIDPASESMKLATLGLRGVAANLLWQKAFEYKKKEQWDNFTATTNQITKLQPNYIFVWEFQAHNLSYNISVEFDDYRQRYHWVKKGLSFLIDGTHYNRENPRLLHFTGWITGQKIGRADEHVQFRQLFREDHDFHDELNKEVVVDNAVGYDGRPDNWLVGRLWYVRAERSVDEGAIWKGKSQLIEDDDPLRGKSPLVFHNDAPMSLINYASTIEEEGILGQTAQRAWYVADKGWVEFGKRPIPTSWGHTLRLGDYEKVKKDVARMRKRFDDMTAGIREQIKKEKTAALTSAEREALNTPEEKLNEGTYAPHYEAVAKTMVSYDEIAARAPAAVRDKAIQLASRLEDQEELARRIASYRGIVNYDYWKMRSEAEQKKVTVEARECIYKAEKEKEAADPEKACKLYESAWQKWAEIFKEFPRLKDDVESEDLVKSIRRYRRLLQSLDEDLPKDFILRDMLKGKEGFKDLYGDLDDSNPEESEHQPAKSGDDTAAAPAEPTPEAKPEQSRS